MLNCVGNLSFYSFFIVGYCLFRCRMCGGFGQKAGQQGSEFQNDIIINKIACVLISNRQMEYTHT